ncbi:MAG: hypothetical protein IKO34_02285 [Bacteroidales bacterium]|nr:hypothetical protein [Bacteroidales bacterium]
MVKNKTYKWLRGLLQASAFTSVMFIMQACYGTPNYRNEESFSYEVKMSGIVTDSASAQPLSGINVSTDISEEVAVSDENGQFCLSFMVYSDDDSGYNLNFSDSLDRYAPLDTLIDSNFSDINISLAAK